MSRQKVYGVLIFGSRWRIRRLLRVGDQIVTQYGPLFLITQRVCDEDKR